MQFCSPRGPLVAALAGGIGTAAVGQTATMPPPAISFTGFTRGYWFTVPTTFRITGVQVLQTAGGTSAFMNYAVVRFHNNAPPPNFGAVTNAFDQLELGLDQPAGVMAPISITVNAGEVIGIYGNTTVAAGGLTGTNSYTAVGTQATTTIFGNVVNLNRSGMQFHLGVVTSPQGMHDLWGDLSSTEISRVEFTYEHLNPNATGACCFTNGTCQFITLGACEAQGGNFRGQNIACVAANCPQPGACCLSDGSCQLVLPLACTTVGGVFNASVTCAQASCPQPRGCCFLNGTCTSVLPNQCVDQGGVPQAGACGTCPSFEIVSDRPGTYVDITATGTYYNLGDDENAEIVSAVGNALLSPGTHRVSNNGAVAWGNLGGTSFANTALPSTSLASGNKALAAYWDDLLTINGAPGGQGVYVREMNGTLYITWNVGHYFFPAVPTSAGLVQLQVFSTGPVAAQYLYPTVDQYGPGVTNGESATIGVQGGPAGGANNFLQYSFNTAGSVTNGLVLSIVQQGGPAVCYANCDNSTTVPVLNVQDFTCFLQRYAAGDSYANCDASTTPPTLNVQDFTCFLQRYAAGCP
jgi:hypothetical protein